MVILSAARLAPQKGLEYLIDAIPFLINHLNLPFRVVLAGDGPLSSQLKDRVKNLGVENYVIFLGFRSDVGNLLAASDIVVIPSLWEGLSISLLEAMGAGKPIITTTIGSNTEVLSNRENALLIPPKDTEALAKAIIELAQNPDLLQHLATKAQALFESTYSEEKMLQKYKEAYLKLLKQKGIV
jgi:glycosyltransferase involved in cell wall biosynthesis